MISIQSLFLKDDAILNLLDESAMEGVTCAQSLNRLVQSRDVKPTLQEFVQSRRKNKDISKEIGERIVKALVTEMDREDIEALSSALYKVPKTIEKFAERYLIVFPVITGSDFTRQAYLLEQATNHVHEIVQALRKKADLEQIKSLNNRLQQVEGDADKLMLELLEDLYCGKHDTLKIIALKDLYEMLEKVIDRCRDAGNAVMQIVLKHS